ncbi:MAG: 6,7-dimethyl-8-ribityllumazine synthase [Rickettsiales bacterium]|jgi:6,7-dimethyl-8-ribityllumazine synthase
MKKILIISANFYQDISEMLIVGAVQELKDNNFDYELINTLGALEIPAIISMAVKSNKFSGFIALGAVIRGETTHYDYVCSEVMRGINNLAINQQLAIGNSILTCENKQQAIVRADIKQKNKGGFAAKVCLETIKIKENIL